MARSPLQVARGLGKVTSLRSGAVCAAAAFVTGFVLLATATAKAELSSYSQPIFDATYAACGALPGFKIARSHIDLDLYNAGRTRSNEFNGLLSRIEQASFARAMDPQKIQYVSLTDEAISLARNPGFQSAIARCYGDGTREAVWFAKLPLRADRRGKWNAAWVSAATLRFGGLLFGRLYAASPKAAIGVGVAMMAPPSAMLVESFQGARQNRQQLEGFTAVCQELTELLKAEFNVHRADCVRDRKTIIEATNQRRLELQRLRQEAASALTRAESDLDRSNCLRIAAQRRSLAARSSALGPELAQAHGLLARLAELDALIETTRSLCDQSGVDLVAEQRGAAPSAAP